MNLKNERGMSIISTLVAAGIGVIVLSGIATMVNNVFKSQRSAVSKDEHREIVESIRKILGDTNTCTASFFNGDPHGNGFSVNQIKDEKNVEKFVVGTPPYTGSIVTIDGFRVQNYKAYNETTNPNIGQSELVIRMGKTGPIVGAKEMETKIYLHTVLSGGTLIQCNSLAGDVVIWQISEANKANIYYATGNVGIGTKTPVTKLDVNGEIKVGNTNLPCTSATEGMQRYNFQIHDMEFCGGSPLAWKPLTRGRSTIITGTKPTCPSGTEAVARRWTTPSCVNHGNPCTLYQGWSGNPPSCESCVDWEKCHICYARNWDGVECR